MTFSLTAQAAVYKPNQVYVDPAENTKGQYYSLLKKRMKTYDDSTIKIVYPKGATLSVKSSKKALGAEITKQQFEDPSDGEITEKVYVQANPNPTNITYIYTNGKHTRRAKNTSVTDANGHTYYKYIIYDDCDGSGWYYKNYTYYNKVYIQANPTNAEKTYWYIDDKGSKHRAFEGSTPGTFYIQLGGVNVNVTPNKVTQYADNSYAVTIADGSTSYKDLYDDGDGKGWYYKNYNGTQYSNDQSVEQPGSTSDYEYSTAIVTLSATKAGTYTVTVKAGSITKKVKVLVTANDGAFKSAKLGKQVIKATSRKGNNKKFTTTSVYSAKISGSLKSAKFKVSGEKGIKVTGMIVQYIDKNGKKKYQTVKKNGGKIKLSQDYENKSSSWDGSESRNIKKETNVLVSYKDTFLGTYTKYSVVTKHGYKQIKCTQKDQSGKVRVSYFTNSSSYTFWTY